MAGGDAEHAAVFCCELCHRRCGVLHLRPGGVPRPGLVLDRADGVRPGLLLHQPACPGGAQPADGLPGGGYGVPVPSAAGLLVVRRGLVDHRGAGHHGGIPGPALGLVGGVAVLREARPAAVRGGADGVGVRPAGGDLGLHRRGLAGAGGLPAGVGGVRLFLGRVRGGVLAARGALGEGRGRGPAGQLRHPGV